MQINRAQIEERSFGVRWLPSANDARFGSRVRSAASALLRSTDIESTSSGGPFRANKRSTLALVWSSYPLADLGAGLQKEPN